MSIFYDNYKESQKLYDENKEAYQLEDVNDQQEPAQDGALPQEPAGKGLFHAMRDEISSEYPTEAERVLQKKFKLLLAELKKALELQGKLSAQVRKNAEELRAARGLLCEYREKAIRLEQENAELKTCHAGREKIF